MADIKKIAILIDGDNAFRKFCESLSPNYTIVLHEDGVTMSLKRVG
ncbi:MAG: hypothetical protein LBR66_09635 [Candidatus Symbiothrix sp.]|jgi:hypothetical protein|nr:hypothetical protein [Candidatus Symbiothrix sp.]